MKKSGMPPEKGYEILFWRLQIGAFWNPQFMTLSKRLKVML